jgi:hypothetical protein
VCYDRLLLRAFAADRAALRVTVPVLAELLTTRAFFGAPDEAFAFLELFPAPFILAMFSPGVRAAGFKLAIRRNGINPR